MGAFDGLKALAGQAHAPKSSETIKDRAAESTTSVVSNPFERALSAEKALKKATASKMAFFKYSKVCNDLPEGSTRDFTYDVD